MERGNSTEGTLIFAKPANPMNIWNVFTFFLHRRLSIVLYRHETSWGSTQRVNSTGNFNSAYSRPTSSAALLMMGSAQLPLLSRMQRYAWPRSGLPGYQCPWVRKYQGPMINGQRIGLTLGMLPENFAQAGWSGSFWTAVNDRRRCYEVDSEIWVVWEIGQQLRLGLSF